MFLLLDSGMSTFSHYHVVGVSLHFSTDLFIIFPFIYFVHSVHLQFVTNILLPRRKRRSLNPMLCVLKPSFVVSVLKARARLGFLVSLILFSPLLCFYPSLHWECVSVALCSSTRCHLTVQFEFSLVVLIEKWAGFPRPLLSLPPVHYTAVVNFDYVVLEMPLLSHSALKNTYASVH